MDKKDLFSESDPFFTISRLNPDGTHTIVYRSEYVKVTPTKTLRVVLLRKVSARIRNIRNAVGYVMILGHFIQ